MSYFQETILSFKIELSVLPPSKAATSSAVGSLIAYLPWSSTITSLLYSRWSAKALV